MLTKNVIKKILSNKRKCFKRKNISKIIKANCFKKIITMNND